MPPLRSANLWLLALLATFALSCHTAVPSIFLQVEDPSGLEPDQLRVTVRVEGLESSPVVVLRPQTPSAPLTGTQTLRLLLPDAAAGNTAQLSIEGLKAGNPVGVATASAGVLAGEESQVTVALVAQTACPGGVCACDEGSCPTGCCQGGVCTTPDLTHCGAPGTSCAPCPEGRADRCTEGACRCGGDPACAEGYACEGGLCVAAVSTCTGETDCRTPPGQCFESQGSCGVDGRCTYAPKAATAACDDGNACTDSDVCNGSGVCAGAAKVCNTPSSSCQESAGTCVSGTCSYAFRPESSGCDDGNACTTGDACNASGVCGGAAMSCNSPPNQCFNAGGVCAAGVCNYSPKGVGSGCDDGNACTTGDACNASSICGGTPVSCTSPPGQCYQSTGTCSGGSCSYAPKGPGASCDDGNACTTGDRCNGSGGCAGTPMACNSPPGDCYQDTGTCSAGTCSYAPKGAGASCSDGNECSDPDVCNGSGSCVGSNVPNGTRCSEVSCGKCSGGVCGYGCTALQQCCPGDYCFKNFELCGPEPIAPEGEEN